METALGEYQGETCLVSNKFLDIMNIEYYYLLSLEKGYIRRDPDLSPIARSF